MLVSAKEMLQKAKAGKYTVGQFNINNLEWTKAILLTAQELNSPVILGVSEGAGKYMCGYNTVTVTNSSVRLTNGEAKYALYPVWLLNTTWRGEKYIFAMNGQTGKFVGNLPVDRGAWWRWFGLFTALFGAAIYLVWTLVQGL